MATRIDQVKADAETAARKQVAADLGIRVADLDADLRNAVRDSVDRQFKAKVANRAVNGAVNAAFTKDALSPALKRLNDIQLNTVALPELKTALEKNAELLFKTYDAFVTAGFTTDQAFQIILAQLQRR